MFEETRAMFLCCVSPLHMGAGTTFGEVDNPIQRERHTNHPIMAGSGIKGALRHHLEHLWPRELVGKLFGPRPQETEHAGALSFTDAHLVAFPVRSLKQTFVYATCPSALARLQRTLYLCGQDPGWGEFSVLQGQCRLTSPGLLSGDCLILESFQLRAADRQDKRLSQVAEFLSEQALPPDPAFAYFREKLATDLVLLSEEEFGYFVASSTVVEPHVRIDDVTGVADDGGLFYTENLPPESLLVSLALATQERTNGTSRMAADRVMAALVEGSDGHGGLQHRLLQFGGDATVGRGLAILTFTGGQ